MVRRYARRASKLTAGQEWTIRALAGTKSLSSLAADFGISHETIGVIADTVIRTKPVLPLDRPHGPSVLSGI